MPGRGELGPQRPPTVLLYNMRGSGGEDSAAKWTALRTAMRRAYGPRSVDNGAHTIALVQECGRPPSRSWVLSSDRGGMKVYYSASDELWCYALEFGVPTNLRVSTGIIIHDSLRERSGNSRVRTDVLAPPNFDVNDITEARRRVLCLRLSPYDIRSMTSRYAEKKWIWYCSIHAPSGATNPGRLTYIRQMLTKCKRLGSTFVCGGDYNTAPRTNPGRDMRLTVSSGGTATHEGGGEYDYVVTQGVLYQYQGQRPGPSGGSDHGLVVFKQTRMT